MEKKPLILRWPGIISLLAVLILSAVDLSAQTRKAPTLVTNYTIKVIKGQVQVKRARSETWDPAYTNQVLFVDDRVRVGPKSQLTIQSADQSSYRLDEKTEFQVVSPKTPAQKSTTMRLITGVLYFFHRGKPDPFDVETRTASAAIRGTEFNLQIDDTGTTIITVVDGIVDLSNEVNAVLVLSGQQGVAQPGQAPFVRPRIDAINNIIQWSLYYPGILDANEIPLTDPERGVLASSLVAYRSGDLVRAVAEYPAGREPQSEAERMYLAGILLSVGQVDDAQQLVAPLAVAGAAGQVSTNTRLAGALQQVIATVKLQPTEPKSPAELASEWLAESYRLQSLANLEGALSAARKSVENSPEFGFGWARVAELEFSFGRTDAATEAVSRALQHSPRNAQAVALNGFLFAARNKIDSAIQEFNKAIEIDGGLANAWLGRGLCLIRKGQQEAGREDLLTAAAVEPQRAFLRSYLGKAWTDAGEKQLAENEFDLAKQFDPRDPTAWLYSALLKQQYNRINEAIRDIGHAQDLSTNRAIYRSGFLLDQDRAVRSANLARIYEEAGMSDVAVREAGRAVTADYANYSAHIFLANSYEAQRRANLSNLRFETSALNEYLLANLLGPASGRLLAQPVTQLDYGSLFERNRLGLIANTEYFSRGAWHHSSAQYGTWNGSSYSLEAEYRTDPGERVNQDREMRQLEAKFKHDLTPDDSLYLHIIDFESNGGDILQRFDESEIQTTFRFEQEQRPTILTGYRRQWAPQHHTLVLAGRFDHNTAFSDPSLGALALDRGFGQIIGLAPVAVRNDYNSDLEVYTAELQQIAQFNRNTIIAGFRGEWSQREIYSRTADPNGMFLILLGLDNPISVQDIELSYYTTALYAYDYFQVSDTLQIVGGVNFTYQSVPLNPFLPPVSSETEQQDDVSPKAGIIWSPATNWSMRGTYSKSLTGFGLGQSVRLEPSQVAGLVQHIRAPAPLSLVGELEGADVTTAEVLWEGRLRDTYFALGGQRLEVERSRQTGLFLSHEDYDPPPTLGLIREDVDFLEHSLYLALHQLVGEELSFGLQYRVSHAELDRRFPEYPGLGVGGVDDESEHRGWLHNVTLSGLYRHPSGIFARAEAGFFLQERELDGAPLEDDEFWQINVVAGYRFPRQRAEIAIGVLNILDQDYRLDPINQYTELPRSRTFYARCLLNF